MKQVIFALILAMVWVVPTSADVHNIDVVKQHNQGWKFKRLRSFITGDNETKVTGRLNSYNRGYLPSGHVDIAVYMPSGEKIAETTSYYFPKILTQKTRNKGGVRFSAVFDQTFPSEAVIKVAFHRDIVVDRNRATHSETLAK